MQNRLLGAAVLAAVFLACGAILDASPPNLPLVLADEDDRPPNRLRGTVRDRNVTPGDARAWPAEPDVAPGRREFGSLTKPLFADPNYHGSCDPEIIWNPAKREWFLYYTARRATRERASYVGTPLGVISSPDLISWRFRGYCAFEGKKGRPDNEDTHWAPGILVAGDRLHMFATYKASAEPPWGGDGVIRHYVAPLDDPIDGWQLAEVPELQQPDPIDVSLVRVGDEYRAYYRVGKGGGIQWASSPDLVRWTKQGKCLGDVNAPPPQRGFGYQEAPYVFHWQDRYWMLTDPHKGLAVYHSPDGVTWTQQESILRDPGEGQADATLARHPSVALIGDRAFVFYHTEPNRPYPTPPPDQRSPQQKISFLQMAELGVEAGRLICDRNADVTLAARAWPSFLFILTDDQGWTSMSTSMDKEHPEYASDFHQTPHLDQFLRDSMRFSRGYSPAPNCSPSRYANLTGKTCARLHFTDIVGRANRRPPLGTYRLRPIAKDTTEIRQPDITVPELLKTLNAGYVTGHFGKWHLGGGGPEQHGFDVSDGPTGNGDGNRGQTVNEDPKRAFSVTQRALEFIADAADRNQPFYCQVSHYAVHAAIQHRAATLSAFASRASGQRHRDPAYAAMVADLDAAVGQLLQGLDERGLRDNTYVIYQADNGCPQFLSTSAPLRRFKPETWDGGIRVPTIVRGPGIAADSQCDSVMMGIDLLPTIWDWAGGDHDELPRDLDGGTLVPAIAAVTAGRASFEIDRPGEVVAHSPHYVLSKDLLKNQRPSTVLHRGPWKLMAWYETGAVELFKMDEDISESTDVATRYPEQHATLRVRLRDYLKAVDAQMPTLDAKSFGQDSESDDVDQDGLPDEWEFRELLTWTAGASDDPDSDGRHNLAEFQADTDPLVAD